MDVRFRDGNDKKIDIAKERPDCKKLDSINF